MNICIVCFEFRNIVLTACVCVDLGHFAFNFGISWHYFQYDLHQILLVCLCRNRATFAFQVVFEILHGDNLDLSNKR